VCSDKNTPRSADLAFLTLHGTKLARELPPDPGQVPSTSILSKPQETRSSSRPGNGRRPVQPGEPARRSPRPDDALRLSGRLRGKSALHPAQSELSTPKTVRTSARPSGVADRSPEQLRHGRDSRAAATNRVLPCLFKPRHHSEQLLQFRTTTELDRAIPDQVTAWIC